MKGLINMKKIAGILLAFSACFFLAGCNSIRQGASASETSRTEKSKAASEQAIIRNEGMDGKDEKENLRVSYKCKLGSVSLCIPDGWSYQTEKYKKTKEGEAFGITFWKNSPKKKNKISIQYTNVFGVCGTGLKTKKVKINGISGEAGYYDGKTYWEYIVLGGRFKNTITILNFCESESWWERNADQIMEILNTLIYKIS